MRTLQLNIYKFDELPTDEAKEKARNWWKSAGEFHWSDESIESINAFCGHFGVKLTTWCVAPYETPDYHADYFNSHFRGCKLRDFSFFFCFC